MKMWGNAITTAGKMVMIPALFMLFAIGCAAESPSGDISSGATAGVVAGSIPVTVAVTASPTSINTSGSSVLSALVTDSAAANIADGTTVTWSLSNTALGTITASSSTTSGTATATFTAGTTAGTVTVTATAGTVSNTATITITVPPATVAVTASPASITIGATSSISAIVKDATSANVADGTTVTWTISPTTIGTITASSTTNAGTAIATFTAGITSAGTVTVTATAGTVSSTATVVVTPANSGSIVYTSATPQIINLQGGGGNTTSVVIFTVKDVNGNAVFDGTLVDVTLVGPNGGEFIDTDATPLTKQVSTVAGVATINVNSGNVAGNITLTASINGTAPLISTSSAVISVGGGSASMTAFTIATDIWNVAGLVRVNELITLSVFAADRFGNANILTGTTVNFYPESGATTTSTGTLSSSGTTTMVLRSQNPVPKTVAALAWEGTLRTAVIADYGITVPVAQHPRIGWNTVLFTMVGEEAFADANGNGVYNLGVDTFTDTSIEPYEDWNDSNARDDGTGTDPMEDYVDVDKNAAYTAGNNGVWDSSKVLSSSLTVIYSTGPIYVGVWDTATPQTGTVTVANGSSTNINIMVADNNLNAIEQGSTIATTATSCTNGTLTGATSVTVPNNPPSTGTTFSNRGFTEFTVNLADTGAAAQNCAINVAVTWNGGTTNYPFSVSIQ